MPANKLFNKNFTLLFQGQLISQIGSFIYAVSFIFWLKHATESATVIGLFFMISMLPGVLLGPLGGAIADRYSRKKIIVLGDLINGSLILMVTAVMFLLPTASSLIITLLFITALSGGIVGAFFKPAVSAAIPDLVPRHQINSANGILQSSVHIASLIGQTIGGILYSILGAPVLMLINGITYLLSALSESFITIPQKLREKPVNNKKVFKQLKIDMAEGFRYVRHTSGLRDLFLMFAVWYFFANAISVLLPFFVEDTLQSTPDWYGFLMVAMACGVLSGNSLVAIVKVEPLHKRNWVIIALFILGFSVVGFGYSSNIVMALGMRFVQGLCGGVIIVLVMSAIQLTTPSEIRGRVLGLLNTVMAAVSPIAMGLTGVITDFLDQDITLILLFCGLCISLVSLYLLFSTGVRALLNYEESEIDTQLHRDPMY